MIDFPTLSYNSTCEFLTLCYARCLKEVPIRADTVGSAVGYYKK